MRKDSLRLRLVAFRATQSDAFTSPRLNSDPPSTIFNTSKIATMSHEEDLIDYSDDELNQIEAPATGGGKKGDAAIQNVDKKGSYVGIHSTGFRDFLLKPSILRAIGDCGFEHPSEG